MAAKGFISKNLHEVQRSPNYDEQMLLNEGFTIEFNQVVWQAATKGEAAKMKDIAYQYWLDIIEKDAMQCALAGKYYMENHYEEVLVPSGKFYYNRSGFEVDVDWGKNKLLGFSWKNATSGYALELKQISDKNVS